MPCVSGLHRSTIQLSNTFAFEGSLNVLLPNPAVGNFSVTIPANQLPNGLFMKLDAAGSTTLNVEVTNVPNCNAGFTPLNFYSPSADTVRKAAENTPAALPATRSHHLLTHHGTSWSLRAHCMCTS